MNGKQKLVLVFFSIGVIVLGVCFVPWIVQNYKGVIISTGCSPIWAPIEYRNETVLIKGIIDTSGLAVELAALLLITLASFFICQDTQKT